MLRRLWEREPCLHIYARVDKAVQVGGGGASEKYYRRDRSLPERQTQRNDNAKPSMTQPTILTVPVSIGSGGRSGSYGCGCWYDCGRDAVQQLGLLVLVFAAGECGVFAARLVVARGRDVW